MKHLEQHQPQAPNRLLHVPAGVLGIAPNHPPVHGGEHPYNTAAQQEPALVAEHKPADPVEAKGAHKKTYHMKFGESPIQDPQTAPERVADNLYKTFWFSQGESGLDRALINLVANQYTRTWTNQDWRAARGHVGNFDDPAFQKLGMPRSHVDPRGATKEKGESYADTVRKEFESRWQAAGLFFKESPSEAARDTEAMLDYNLAEAETRMIYSDHRYAERERRFNTSGDKHESIYRTYVLEGRPTGSEAFDAIFAKLRQRFVENGPPEPLDVEEGQVSYADMVAAWQAKHPGETYEPADPAIQAGLKRGEQRDKMRSDIHEFSQELAKMSLPLGGLIAAVQARLGRRERRKR